MSVQCSVGPLRAFLPVLAGASTAAAPGAGRGLYFPSCERRNAMVCLAFALLLFALVAYLAVARCCLRNSDFLEDHPDITGATS